MVKNLLRDTWTNLDSRELRLLLNSRIGGLGQYDNQEANPNKFYLPLARESCRVALTYQGRKIVAVERGPAFSEAEWRKIADEIENKILVGPSKVGREYSFSSFRVAGSWRGTRSGVQILPAPPEAPRAPVEIAEHPFILEFPIIGAPDDLWPITNHRRMREHRRLTLLLNVLLTARLSSAPWRAEHFWAHIPPAEGCHGGGDSRWLQQFFYAPLGTPVADALSLPSAEKVAEIEPEAYFTNVGHDGNPLRVPADLDESLCRYRDLSEPNRSKFDRAAFWFHMASRQWIVSVSSSFASLVSAVEALTDRGTTHRVYCEHCQADRSHEEPGATKRFWSFFETYAPGAALRKRRTLMYELRSGILHGSDLMQMDQDLAFGWDPPQWNEHELHSELWSITSLALRNWLKNPPANDQPIASEHKQKSVQKTRDAIAKQTFFRVVRHTYDSNRVLAERAVLSGRHRRRDEAISAAKAEAEKNSPWKFDKKSNEWQITDSHGAVHFLLVEDF
jgi:hypothetical protein